MGRGHDNDEREFILLLVTLAVAFFAFVVGAIATCKSCKIEADTGGLGVLHSVYGRFC